ncbi:MAG: hypothetical protein ABJM19_10615 [Marinobacter sp.]|uniref:hypothetical protein n=1 Tax=unclassified Marinobacter TaxID=83889 RepID=UPI00273B150B|nr:MULTISPECIES: hypothetical protein [unclassified Marinobacter]MDP4546424.1 hypothetical protein [Marinobacter sp. MDS2]
MGTGKKCTFAAGIMALAVVADHPELLETKYLDPYYYYDWAFYFAQDYVLLAGF